MLLFNVMKDINLSIKFNDIKYFQKLIHISAKRKRSNFVILYTRLHYQVVIIRVNSFIFKIRVKVKKYLKRYVCCYSNKEWTIVKYHDTEIIQKKKRFSMLYFSIVCEHSSKCSDCVEKCQTTMTHPTTTTTKCIGSAYAICSRQFLTRISCCY